jgi:xylitol oxidase
VREDRPVTISNWAGNVTFSTDRLQAPTAVEQLQQIVAGAERIHALGTGHSFNRIADTDGELVTVRELPGGLEIDREGMVVTVPAGARYGEVAQALHERGLALHNLGSLPHISVAGACATGTHGSGNANQCLAGAVRGIEFVRADGELVAVAADEPSFPGSVIALGALGVVTRLTLAVEPTYDVAQDVWLDAPVERVVAAYDEITASGYSVSLFSWPEARDRVDQIWVKCRAGEPAVDGRAWGARPAETDVHPVIGQDSRAATEQRGIRGAWHERLPHFRASFTPSAGDEQQTEFLIPREHGAAAVAAVLALDLTAALQVAEFRTIAADDLWLSPYHGRATTGVHFTWHNDDDVVSAALEKVSAALAPFDPRPHWGKVFPTSRDELARHYPTLPEFRALVDRYDPGRKFGNDYLATYVY